jgi:hypothetical protein
MYPAFPITGSNATADEVAVGAVSAQFGNITAMGPGQYFLLTSNVALWWKQGSNPTASAASGSMYLPANTPVFINGALGIKLAVIEDSSGGKASLVQVQL